MSSHTFFYKTINVIVLVNAENILNNVIAKPKCLNFFIVLSLILDAIWFYWLDI